MLTAFLFSFFTALSIFQITKLVIIYAFRCPRNLVVLGLPTVLGKWISGLSGIVRNPKITLNGHQQSAGRPFAIPSLTNYHVCVSNPEQIAEVSHASSQLLSFNEFLRDSIFPKYTMEGWSYDPLDPHNRISVSALKSGLRGGLPLVRPVLEKNLEAVFRDELSSKENENGWIRVSASYLGYRVAGTLNAHAILGEEICCEDGYVEAALQYAWDAAITTEILRFTPSWLQDPVGFLSMQWSGASRRLERRISSIIVERLRGNASPTRRTHCLDCIQWLVDAAQKQTKQNVPNVKGIAQRTLGFLFAAAHQSPMLTTFALYNLCKYPEYLEPLRKEALAALAGDTVGCDKDKTPLLDSFLKETARLFPLQTVVMDRKVMHPFTFSDGTHVPAGNLICIPQQAVMLDVSNYPEPNEFQGFRFVQWSKDGECTSTSRFTHPSPQFPFWGSVSRACPARFYVSMIIKMTMIHLITNYDVRLEREPAVPYFSWASNMIPKNLILCIRRRS